MIAHEKKEEAEETLAIKKTSSIPKSTSKKARSKSLKNKLRKSQNNHKASLSKSITAQRASISLTTPRRRQPLKKDKSTPSGSRRRN